MPSGIDLLGEPVEKSGLSLLGSKPEDDIKITSGLSLLDPVKPAKQPLVAPALISTGLVNMLKRHEGFRGQIYKDSVGISTIGYGHNIEAREAEFTEGVTEDAAEQLLLTDIGQAQTDIRSIFPNFSDFSEDRQNALTDMMFNLGKTRFSGFKKMIAAVNEDDWEEAAAQAKDSKWHKQVGRRSIEIEKLLSASEDIKAFYGTTAISPPFQGLAPMIWTPEIASYMGKQGFGPKPEGGWDELGNPLDVNKEPYYSHEKATGVVAETLQGLSSLASHPMEVVRGGLDFALSIPGFLTGIMSASSAITGRIIDNISKNPIYDPLRWDALDGTTLEDFYNIASEEMQKSAEFFDPGKRLLTGKPTPESELATQIVMVPMTGLSMVGHKVANYEGFKDSPNIRGAAKFAGDIAGLATMGFLLHKGSRPKFTRKVEEVIKEADEIIVKEHAVQGIPNELIKQANQKVINAEKVQLDLKAKEIAKEVAEEARIKGEEVKQAEGIIKAKSEPEVKAEPVEVKPKAKIEPVKAKPKMPKIEEFPEFPEVKIIPEEFKIEPKPVTEVDRMTGVELPELKGDSSPFFQDRETTDVFSKIYEDRKKSVETDVELMTQKLINDTNKWYHGDETVPIERVKNTLSEVASRADELRMEFITGQDHLLWKETVREAADWAKNLDRLKIKRSIYRQGRPDGKWWTPDREYADSFGKPFKETIERKLSKDAKLIDEEVLKSKLTDKERKMNEMAGYDEALDRLGYDGFERLEETMDIGSFKSYYIKDRLKIERTEGVELYAGLSPKEVTKVINSMIKGTGNFMTGFKASAKTKEFDFDYAVKQIKSDTIRALSDQSETLLNIVKKKYPEDYNRIVSRQRSAITGKGWGRVLYEQAEREIFRGKSKEMLDATNAYILARRFKDIYSYRTEKGYKHQPGFGPEDVINTTSMIEMFKNTTNQQFKALRIKFPKINEMFGKLTADQFKEVVKASDTYFEWSRKMVDDLVEAGLKTVEEGELLKAHDFRKFKTIRVEKLYDFDYNLTLKGETMKATNSGVQPLGLGSTKMIEPDARTVLSEQFSRVYGSISNQAAKLEWKALAEKHPESGFVSVKQVKNWSPMPYMDKGVRKNIYFHPDAAKYLVTQSKDLSPRLASVLRGLFLAPVTRALAVGASPMWATFIGIPMDMMHSLWTARTWEADAKGIKPKASFPFYETTQGKFKKVYSSFPAVDKLQLGLDMARTFRDVYKRGPLTKNLMKHGLVMNFLTQRMSRYMKGTKPPGDWARMMDLVSYHGMSMELWVRAATADRIIRREAKKKGITYEQGLKDKDIMYKSVHSARDRMDYNQGGWLVKALDSAGMIFLNAGVLGTRTFWRQTTSNPVDFTVRTGRIMATAAGLTATAWMLYPEIMKDVPIKGNEKNAVWPLFPEWLKTKDIDGNDVTFHLKLRMDPGGAFMYRVSENLTKTYMYDKGLIKEEPDYHELVDSLKRIGPVNITLPPTAQLFVDYVTNYSWWKERQMYTELGGKTLPWGESKHEGEFDRSVSQLAKDIGRTTGASPKRLQGAGSNVIPYSNEFAWAMGKAYEQAFSDVPEEARKQHWLITLADSPGFDRVIGITRHGQGRWKIKSDIENKIELKTMVRNNKFDMLATDWAWYGARDKKEVIDFIKEQKDIDVMDNMMDKLEFVSDPLIKTLPHRRFWLSMRHMSVEGRARTWFELGNRITDTEKEQYKQELAQVAELEGIVTDEFLDELEKLQQGE